MINVSKIFAISSYSVGSYINGNYIVEIRDANTRIKRALRRNEEFCAAFPDSIDLKITNKCNIGCPFCHESSTPSGNHANLIETEQMLDQLPKVGLEIAVGGGDVLEIPEDELCLFFDWLIKNEFYPRVTLNYKSLSKLETMKKFVRVLRSNKCSIGISVKNYQEFEELVKMISDKGFYYNDNSKVVFHIIVGVFPITDLAKLLNSDRQILILGYKQFGRALNKPMESKIFEAWGNEIAKLFYECRYGKQHYRIAFDNLAIEQLGIRDILLDEEWNYRYLGEEFTTSMYVDAVNQTFAPTSRDTHRTPWSETKGIIDYFSKNHR